MRARVLKWIVPCLLLLAGACLFWRSSNRPAETVATAGHFSYTAPRPVLPGQSPDANKSMPARVKAALATNEFAMRLSNTPKSIGELINDRHAILLENALIDTRNPLNFSIPKNLQSSGEPGAYIVQARGPVDAAFRAALARAGAQIVSYIPNDAYLVRVPASGADEIQASGVSQSVIPYEPYYKIQSSLLNAAVGQHPLPAGAALTLGLFADGAPQTISQIEKLGGVILARDQSPFGPMVRVQPPQNWTALATLPGVQIVEPFHPRVHANDLSRVSTGVSTNTLTGLTYFGLSGSNVIVAVPDSGIDATHPAFTTGGSLGAPGAAPVRVFGLTTNDLADTDGHGTFVGAEIAGNGDMSTSPVNVGGILASMNYGSVTNADFRGKAPLAKLFSMNLNQSDQQLQAAAALTNALISNNSWNHDSDNTYDLAAASYDAATRDALPLVTGSQPVLFVFSAGNAGSGGDSTDPGGGDRDSILSPATAKNVIAVGAIQENRGITNQVTAADGTTNEPWLEETSTGYRVAGFSSRGNVGIGIEGASGRFKPDVVAPGTFIVSARSSQWNTANYFYQNPTNNIVESFPGIVADPDSLWVNGFPLVPTNAIGVNITVSANGDSPSPFPTLPIYVGLYGAPFPGTAISPAIPNQVNIPSDGGYAMADIFNNEKLYGFNYGISNINSSPISFDLTTTIILTNSADNHLQVLSNLDNTLGPYYRFETGTSMSAADVSGVLALMQDFFVNHSTLTNPSPALLKAMLINGARTSEGVYDFNQPDGRNYEGWGLVNLPNSLPPAIRTNFNGTVASSIFIQDQSRTNALATGDSHAYQVTIKTTNAVTLHVTLAWTDPPGNPAAAIKLVNNLELVVTNLDNPTNPVIYYGNDIPTGGFFNTPESPANPVSVDVINNVQNVIIPPLLGTNYSVTVIGRAVNVNAISAQTNSFNNANPSGIFAPNVVQDYALVITSGDGGAPGSFTVVNNGIVSNPTGDQDITFIAQTNAPLMNQMVGASPPLLGTNTTPFTTNTAYGGAAQVTLGMTNQWHFYVVTNDGAMSNGMLVDAPYAAFVTFSSATLSIPRMGVFANSQANATRPEADIDLYVTTDPTLTNLNPVAISNCLTGGQVGASVNGVFNGASLGRGGTEYVVDNGGSTPGQVYYIGVKSEDQMASEYDFIPIFSNIPFSFLDANGNEIVNGLPVPANIPDGTPAVPGVMNWVFGIAIYPITVGDITVTNVITHQNFGDLYGTLSHGGGGGASTMDVLNNHDGWGFVTNQAFVYNENYPVSSNLLANPPVLYSGPSDGPGSLRNFFGQDGTGAWQLTEVDDALTQTGSVQRFTMFIKKHEDLQKGITVTIQPTNWFYTFMDVPAGVTNLTISATNITTPPDQLNPVQLVIKLGAQPVLTNADKGPVSLTNGTPPGNSLSVGPTDVPPIQPGRYWVGVWNPSATAQTVYLIATMLPLNPVGQETDWTSANTSVLGDDEVMYSDIFVTNNQPIVSLNVGIEVQDPRISDLVFHLISPNGTRVLLMENRGGADTNGAGVTMFVTNVVTTTNAISGTNSFEGTAAGEYTAGQAVGSWTVGTNQVSLVTDPVNAYAGGNNYLALANGSISTNLPTVPGQNYTVAIAYRGPGIAGWWRAESNALDSINGNNGHITFTTTNTIVWTNGFEGCGPGYYYAGTNFAGGWHVEGPSGSYIDVITNGTSTLSPYESAYQGSNCIDMIGPSGSGISTNIATVPGITYTLDFAYTKNPDTGPGQVGIVVDGNPLGITIANQHNAWSSLRWQTASYVFTATLTNTHLAFVYTNNAGISNVLLDAIGLTTNFTSTVTYTNGEVSSAFKLTGSNYVWIPDASSLNPTNEMTVDCWLYRFSQAGNYDPLVKKEDISNANGYSLEFDSGGNGLLFWVYRVGGGWVSSGGGPGLPVGVPILNGQWTHVAGVYTGARLLCYKNGVLSASTIVFGNIATSTNYLGIANDPGNPTTRSFNGLLDEVSIYNRGLSASEIKAIYQNGASGKFDPVVFSNSPARSLAEARFSVTGQSPVTILGNNTNWQTYTATFKAVANQTTLTLAGVEPGMLLGPAVFSLQVTNVITNNLYLTFTENTNLTTTPIKYGVPPFVPVTTTSNIFTDGFEQTVAGDYTGGTLFGNGWTVTSNQVSVVTDAANAYEGSNLLALASGAIFTNLPTVAGHTYTLTFAYRGPGIAGWWQAENNTNDSINGNNPTAVQNITFANGEVGRAFHYDGSTSLITMPGSASLSVSNLTLESWIYPTDNNTPRPVIDCGGANDMSYIGIWIDTVGFMSSVPGEFTRMFASIPLQAACSRLTAPPRWCM